MKGEVVSVDLAGRKFKLNLGRGKEIEVATTDATAIAKGKTATTFEAVVTAGAKLNLEVLNGIAVTITAKK